MVTMSQRICDLRTEKDLSRPQLAAALGLPKNAVEKFETGRQTPTQEQQEKLAAFFGVSLFYLRGESGDRTRMEDWMSDTYPDEAPEPRPAPVRRPSKPAPAAVSGSSAGGTMFDGFLDSPKFQENLRQAVLDVLRSPEGEELLSRFVQKELAKRR